GCRLGGPPLPPEALFPYSHALELLLRSRSTLAHHGCHPKVLLYSCPELPRHGCHRKLPHHDYRHELLLCRQPELPHGCGPELLMRRELPPSRSADAAATASRHGAGATARSSCQ
ncbi:unnamed protein product, partial [Urochloa humidicola]